MTTTPFDFRYLYISLPNTPEARVDADPSWQEIGFRRTHDRQCFIFAKLKKDITRQDELWLATTGHVPDNWNYPDIYPECTHEYPPEPRLSTHPSVLIIGHAGHGKTTVAHLLKIKHQFSYKDSSQAALETAIWPALQAYYPTPEGCYQDRHQWRTLWYELIRRFNTPDALRLAQLIMADHDVYVGMRSRREFDATMQHSLFDAVVWVAGRATHPAEHPDSMQLTRHDATHIVDNSGTLADTAAAVDRLATQLHALKA